MPPKFPSFKAIHGRSPEPGLDFDPNGSMCQDDYEYYSGTGRYTDHPEQEPQPEKDVCPYCHGTNLDLDGDSGGGCTHCILGYLP